MFCGSLHILPEKLSHLQSDGYIVSHKAYSKHLQNLLINNKVMLWIECLKKSVAVADASYPHADSDPSLAFA